MAFIKTHDALGSHITPCSIEKAVRVWNILQGHAEPQDEAQAAYMDKVEDVLMSPRNPLCPESYRIARQHVHAAMQDKRHQAEQLPWHAITKEDKETV